MISITTHGDLSKTLGFLGRAKNANVRHILDKYGKLGVEALASVTPKRTGVTAASWYYEIVEEDGVDKLIFHNGNVKEYANIALLLEYGHATRTGGYVEGYHYIDQAIQPIFEELADKAWKEVYGG